MRGPDERQAILFSYRSIEDRIPADHPLRAMRHRGYAVSQRKRKLIEEGFGWQKYVGVLRKLHHRGCDLVRWIFAFTSAAYNLVRLRTLLGAAPA